MHSPKKELFIKEIIKEIKFSFDRSAIEEEIETHFDDRYYYLIDNGYSPKQAIDQTVQLMGDPKSIGQALNKIHHPVIGWLWIITSGLKFIILGILGYILVTTFLLMLFSDTGKNNIPNENILFHQTYNKKVQIDDKIITFTDVIYDDEETLHIFYKHYDKKLLGTGWSMGNIGEISDDLGNTYFSGSTSANNGIISYSHKSLDKFSPLAKEVIIHYDHYNRTYTVVLPIGEQINE